ncbi:MAG TPA: ABC transporter permease subunit [Candidatus Limnocylindria bacterium]|jgi:ABC-2 type transport system permease protein|nr:ABC transporter permease subunit [Candidatus Limnocylindria bacterium]
MTGFGPLLGKELLEQWRTKRLLVVTIVFVMLGIGSAFLARYTAELIQAVGGVPFEIELPEPTLADAVTQFLKNLGQAGILTAILLAMGSVATEKERGTAALLLSKPASRAAYLASKLVAIATTLTIGMVLASIAGYVYTALLFEPPDAAGWAGMTALLLLSLLAYAALTFLGSTLTRSAVAAAAIGVAGMIVLAMVAAVPSIAPYLPAGISGAPAAAIALGTDPGPLLGPIAANVGLVVALAALGWVVFRRQEL